MSLRLSELSACFEGVIPSIVATASADGMPNISYLSHVVRVDDDHVALSNQFFAKTSANIRANPHVSLILVDGFTGDQFMLDIGFSRSIDTGPLFERIALQLKASSAQVGMAEVMRLKSADIFRVHSIEKVPSPDEVPETSARSPISLPALSEAVQAIERQFEAGDIIDSLLSSVRQVLGFDNALVLIRDEHSGALVTMGSSGYERSGLGSEIAQDDGLPGSAAAKGQIIKVSDMSRVRRLGEAIIVEAEAQENATREIAFPQMPGVMSQIAVPIMTRQSVVGVLFVESERRLAFREEDEAALAILAQQSASAWMMSESEMVAVEGGGNPPLPLFERKGRSINITHHSMDDSIFIDNAYIVKGVAGALLRLMVEWHLSDGRVEFSNREMRLAIGGRMPEIKDNLETRLLLLRRRLDEKQSPLRVNRIARGRVRIEIAGALSFKSSGK